MTEHPDDSLTPEEYASLRELNKGLFAVEVLAEHKKKLSKLGLITTICMEDHLTDEGLKRLAQGRP